MAYDFTVKGVPHRAKLNVLACKKVEAQFGKSIFEVLGAKEDGSASIPNISNLSVLFWASLLNENPSITQEEADALLDEYLEDDEHDIESLVELITKALNFTKGSPAQPKAEAVLPA